MSRRLLRALKDEDRDKFKFSVQFQLEVLKYLVQDREAIVYINKIKSSYFTILEHAIICESLLKIFKKYKKIPGEVVLLESVRELLNTKEYSSLVLKEDLPNIQKIIGDIYNTKLVDKDIIKRSLLKFVAFIEIKSLNEDMDFSDYNLYQKYHQRIGKIINEVEQDRNNNEVSHYMTEDIIDRQLRRKINPDVIPSPFKQLNALTNAGGYPVGSIIVLLDKAKAKKTFTMVNVARGYLSMKKNVLYIDTENGAGQIMDRMIQSTLNKTTKDMYSGDFDELEKRHMRKYRRLGVEFIVRRISAMVSDSNDIRTIIEEEEARLGIKIHNVIIDYAGKLASISREKDDFERLNNVYIDLQNLAHDLNIESIWTAHHVTREGSKHQETRYDENDIAGSIAIVRNAVAVIGLNSTEDERENNIQRMEIVVQRYGVPVGRALFNIDVERQRMKEFTQEARRAYDEEYGKHVDESIDKAHNKTKRSRVGNPEKANKHTGDI